MNDHAPARRSRRLRRRWSLTAATLAAVVLSPLTISGSTANGAPADPAEAADAANAQECGVNEILVPNCGVLWGAYSPPDLPGENPATAVTDLEEDIQRQFDIVHRYHDFSGKGTPGIFPDRWERQLTRDDERTLLLNWTTRVHGGESEERAYWKDIYNGKYDESIIRPAARRLAEFGKPLFLAFDHEAEGNRRPGQGDGWDYVQAWRHIHDIFREEGADNVIWTWLHVGWIGLENSTPHFYPGDEYVDWIGYDPFNYYVCRDNEWRTPGIAFGRWYNWLQQNGFDHKPIMLGEYGTVADPADEWAQAQWYRNLVPALQKLPKIKAVVQFNTHKVCDTRVTTRPDVLEAFGEAGRSDYVDIHR
jgi:hypothetical protein